MSTYLEKTAPVPRISRAVYERIAAAAKADRRSVAGEITLAIEEWLAGREAAARASARDPEKSDKAA